MKRKVAIERTLIYQVKHRANHSMLDRVSRVC
jgi:hypothetical protein